MTRFVIRPRIQVPLMVVLFILWSLVGVSYLTYGDVVADLDWSAIAVSMTLIITGAVGIWRALRFGIVIDEAGMRLRNFDSRDQVIPWSSVQTVECAHIDQRFGLPLYGPVIHFKDDAGFLPLRSLGSYSKSDAERRVATLRALAGDSADT